MANAGSVADAPLERLARPRDVAVYFVDHFHFGKAGAFREVGIGQAKTRLGRDEILTLLAGSHVDRSTGARYVFSIETSPFATVRIVSRSVLIE